MKDVWRIWDNDKKYGEVFYKRASGLMPEMESSKAVAKRVEKIISKNDHILDIGCGAGHYLVSLENNLKKDFSYTGIDATENYIERAREAFKIRSSLNKSYRKETDFIIGDIFNIPVPDKSADIVLCNNVLLHLPSIEKPIEELMRVSRKHILIRTLIGETSFRIKHIREPELYMKDGEPEHFYYYNIYSYSYLKRLLGKMENVESFTFEEDHDYNPENIGKKEYDEYGEEKPTNVSSIIGGLQVNGYIIQPWNFIQIKKAH